MLYRTLGGAAMRMQGVIEAQRYRRGMAATADPLEVWRITLTLYSRTGNQPSRPTRDKQASHA